jgi:hypothetical protein
MNFIDVHPPLLGVAVLMNLVKYLLRRQEADSLLALYVGGKFRFF